MKTQESACKWRSLLLPSPLMREPVLLNLNELHVLRQREGLGGIAVKVEVQYRNASLSTNTALPGARVCWFTSMVLVGASVDKVGVLGGRAARRSLLSGTLGGRALMIGFYSSFGSLVNDEMR